MGFAQAISAAFSNYVNFRDRACRSEYWYWILFIVLADIVAGIIDWVLGIQIVTGLFGLVTIIPGPFGLYTGLNRRVDRIGFRWTTCTNCRQGNGRQSTAVSAAPMRAPFV